VDDARPFDGITGREAAEILGVETDVFRRHQLEVVATPA